MGYNYIMHRKAENLKSLEYKALSLIGIGLVGANVFLVGCTQGSSNLTRTPIEPTPLIATISTPIPVGCDPPIVAPEKRVELINNAMNMMGDEDRTTGFYDIWIENPVSHELTMLYNRVTLYGLEGSDFIWTLQADPRIYQGSVHVCHHGEQPQLDN